jgi:hypothetical protein
MAKKSLLTLLGVLLMCPPIYGNTFVTASSTCEAFLNGSPDPIFTQSQSVALTTNGSGIGSPDVPITGLDCLTPYGSVAFSRLGSATFFRSNLLEPGAGISVLVNEDLSILSNDVNTYRFAASVHIHVSSQETLIATGGSGTGVLHGMLLRGWDDFFSQLGFFSITSQSVATPFASCLAFPLPSVNCPLGFSDPVPFSYQFVFGQPFTFNAEIDLANDVSGRLGLLSVGSAVNAETLSVTDVNGNPIPFPVFTSVPEPATAVLGGIGFLLSTILFARSIRRSKSMSRL